MAVTVVRTITEGTNGRRKNEASPTGWERRTGETREQVIPKPGRGRGDTTVRVPIWEPCPAPETWVVGTPEEMEREGRGGTIHTLVEGVEGKAYDLLPGEAETLLRIYCHEYQTGMFIFHGGTVVGGNGRDTLPHEGHAMAEVARNRVLDLFGLDLATTNVASR